MARRRIVEDPVSRLAVWALRLAVFALVAVILGTLLVRSDLLELTPALATVAAALTLAVIAILLGLAALAVIWNEGLGGLGAAVGAIAIGLALIAYPAYLADKAYHLPAITDISTDTDDPPHYETLARKNPGRDSVASSADRQQAAYPDVAPLVVAVPPPVAFDAVYAVMRKRKWHIVEARRPIGNRDGHIEAVARTPIMAFRDDVAVRLRADSDGTRIDVRSSSHYGPVDFGTNAARIVAFLEDVDDAVDALPDTSREPVPQPEARPPQLAKQPQAPRRSPARR